MTPPTPDVTAVVVCDTSPLQYLHQLGHLDLIPRLFGHLLVPSAVAAELEAGRASGYDLPAVSDLPWVTVRSPVDTAFLADITNLGVGERQVLALTVETAGALAILDDGLARAYGRRLQIRLTGTLGVLVRARREGALARLTPILDGLDGLRFRLAPSVRAEVLRLAGESQEK